MDNNGLTAEEVRAVAQEVVAASPASRMTAEQVRTIVFEQDLRNGLGSQFDYVGHALELAEAKGAAAGKKYLKKVGADIITGRGQRAPHPGPVAPE